VLSVKAGGETELWKEPVEIRESQEEAHARDPATGDLQHL
jgi:hypothetical protein